MGLHYGSYLIQMLMDFASIWLILKAKSCWATISEYIRNPNMKLDEYAYPNMPKTLIRWTLYWRSACTLVTWPRLWRIKSLKCLPHCHRVGLQGLVAVIRGLEGRPTFLRTILHGEWRSFICMHAMPVMPRGTASSRR